MIALPCSEGKANHRSQLFYPIQRVAQGCAAGQKFWGAAQVCKEPGPYLSRARPWNGHKPEQVEVETGGRKPRREVHHALHCIPSKDLDFWRALQTTTSSLHITGDAGAHQAHLVPAPSTPPDLPHPSPAASPTPWPSAGGTEHPQSAHPDCK